MEKKLDPERLYQRLKKIIDHVNYLIQVYGGNNDGVDMESEMASALIKPKVCKYDLLDPVKGNVAFAAGKDGWAFTLTQFSDMYKRKLGAASASFIKKLWGNNFYNSQIKK